jgi:methylenetetrahydrofolate reductase (NADPH)
MSYPASATDAASLHAQVADLLAAGSIEISPRELHRAGELAGLRPAGTCVYVPSLPGLPVARMLEAIAAIRRSGLDPVPHISARRIASRDDLREVLKRAAGDEVRPKGPYADSVQLLEEGVLAECGIREIGVAGYPEGHPRISPNALDAAFARKLALAKKQGLGVYVVTQFSFAPNRVVEFCSGLARSAPDLPVYVGVAGPTDPIALARYAQRCGVSTSLRALRNLGTGIAKLVTHTDPGEQLQALARYCLSRESSNVVGVHVYSFGGVLQTGTWMRDYLAR